MVTLRRVEDLPSLRGADAFSALLPAFARGAERPGFRLACFSVQSNHVHMIVEADDGNRLARGLQGLQVRMARALNRVWKRSGSVFEGQYHSRALRTPRAVRRALVYVLQNAHKHGVRFEGLDPCSSARWFRGWSARVRFEPDRGPAPVAEPRTWLLRVAWLRHGLLESDEQPRSQPARRSSSRAELREGHRASAAWARVTTTSAVRGQIATGAA